MSTPFDFNKPQTLDFCLGPVTPGTPEASKFTVTWAAWVADAGIRVGKSSSIVLPANSTGEKSTLYPTTKTTHLSLSFDKYALLAIAIQKTATTIEIKRYTDNIGTIATVSFVGISPQLFCNWLTYFGQNDDETDLVCFYLKASQKNTIFARFQNDNFAIEYVINQNLPADIAYLVRTYSQFNKQIILAKTALGDNATISSGLYGVIGSEASGLSISIESGSYFLRAVNSTVNAGDQANLFVSLRRINKYASKNATVGSGNDKANLSLSIISGNYE